MAINQPRKATGFEPVAKKGAGKLRTVIKDRFATNEGLTRESMQERSRKAEVE